MCRWLAYSGNPLLLEDLLINRKQSLLDQSMASRSAETPTNGDGFGIGWYDDRPLPGLFRSIRPAWNDFNFRDLAAHIRSPLFMAHVRATSLAVVQETNCHPFRYGRWLFVHNGEIFEIEKFRRELLIRIAPEYFSRILGTTDSEILFYLALTFGLETDPVGALCRMAGFVEHVGRSKGIEETLWMTLGITDGKNLYAVRYASDGHAPTLFCSPEAEILRKLNPEAREKLDQRARAVLSEPLGDFQETFREIPQGSWLKVLDGKVEIHPFKPVPPE